MKLLLVLFVVFMTLPVTSCRKETSQEPASPQQDPASLQPVIGRILCPERISVRQTPIVPVSGWDIYTDPSEPDGVDYVNLFYEDPALGEEPINTDSDDVKVEHPRSGMWVLCGYKSTEPRVARPLKVVSKGCRYLRGAGRAHKDPAYIGAYCE